MDSRLAPRSLAVACLMAAALTACPSSQEEEPEPAKPLASADAAQAAAQEICGAIFNCECELSISYADEAACIEDQRATIQDNIDQLLAEGGTWNEDCAGELLWTWKQWDCAGPSEALYTANFDYRECPLVRGELGEGEYCNVGLGYEPCAQGLRCSEGQCTQAPTLPVPLGQPCQIDWEELPCVSGAYCGYDPDIGENVCEAIPSAGDSCDYNYTNLCGPPSNNLLCSPDNVCISAPGEGESCEDALICDVGLYCDGGQDFTCQPRRELGQGCGADAVCPVDASCIGNICVADEALLCGADFI